MWALCHSPLVTEAEIVLPAGVVANDPPKLFGEDLEGDLFNGE